MGTVTCGMAVSLDGYAAGPDQSVENPIGVDGVAKLMAPWMFDEAGQHDAEIASLTTAGAYVMGRNMYGPVRGGWDDDERFRDWRGWWGDEPPYHAPVFVLTHHPHDSIEMEGGTTFHFVTDGVEAALRRAQEVAGDRPVDVSGGASTVNQFLAAGLIDELWLHVVPRTLGAGERLFEGSDRSSSSCSSPA
ncbi:DNA-binding protein [Luteimicrobium album]|uniref:DNA-binding protein n=1 Tax=Luteimicrobium album TaxID=1054550 RepID=A0ABQ6HZN5_9MICO|nr:DNA-binding protein [Luteimicrobium album]